MKWKNSINNVIFPADGNLMLLFEAAIMNIVKLVFGIVQTCDKLISSTKIII